MSEDVGSFSVSEVAKAVGLCRDRFYELMAAGAFPPPVYDVRSRRPFYTAALHATCLSVRASGMGFDGRRILFNRTKGSQTPAIPPPASPNVSHVDGPATTRQSRATHERLARQLRLLGVSEIDADAVQDALRACFPHGTAGVDDGAVLHRLRQYAWPIG